MDIPSSVLGKEQGPQAIMLVADRRQELRNDEWREVKRPVDDLEAIAHYVGAAATVNAIPAQDPIVSNDRGYALMGYSVPEGYRQNPEHTGIRRVLHALVLSFKDEEPANRCQLLVQHRFDTSLKLPDRVLRDNVEAVRYAIALLLGASTPVELPVCDTEDLREIITLGLHATLIALRDNEVKKGDEAINFFVAYIEDDLL